MPEAALVWNRYYD